MKNRISVIVVLLLLFNAANATDYYVNSLIGNNTTGDGTVSNPWKTITYALSKISGTGHVVHVAAGTYNTALGESFPIFIKNGVSLVGGGASTTIIDAVGVNRVMNSIGITDPSTILEGFTITGGSLTSTNTLGSGIYISAGSALTIRNNTISNNTLGTWGSGGGIYISNSSPRIMNNTISDNGADYWGYGDAIAISSGSTPEIKGNLIINNTGSDSYGCIYLNSPSSSPRIINNIIVKNSGNALNCVAGSPTILNNTISDNSGNGIYISSGTPDSIINNILSYNTGYGIYESGTSQDPGKAWYNLFHANENGLYYNEGSTSYYTASSLNSGVAECKNNIEGDPLFKDRITNDYHVNLYSPAVDAGDPAFPYNNEPSPNGNRINIGAYGNTDEATVSLVPPTMPVDLYVNATTGSNITGDGSPGNPWKTITYALSQIIESRHTVHVAEGTYDVALGESFPIVMKNGVSLVGTEAITTIIKASGTVRVLNCIGVTDPSTHIEGFTITGGYLSDTYSQGGGIFISAGSVITIRDNFIKNNQLGTFGYGAGIFMSNSSPYIVNNIISDNDANYWGGGNAIAVYNSSPLIGKNMILSNTGSSSNGCIYVYGSSGSPRIIKNLIAKNSNYGIYCGTGTPTIINNTISDNTGDGIYVSSGIPDSIVNNILSNNSGYGIYESGTSADPGKVWYNLFYVNEDGLYYDEGSTGYYTVSSLNTNVTECKNNIDGDPFFEDKANNNYHLQSGSPAIDTGDPNSPFDPNGTRADIGAFNFVLPPPVPVAITPIFTGQTDFNASWNSSEGATGYLLDIATDIFFATFVTGYNNVDVADLLNYSVTGLTSGTTYYYRVRAYNINGTSSSSNTITVTTLSTPPGTPSAPEAYSANNITQSGFQADWSYRPGATAYQLDVAVDDAFTIFVAGFNNIEIQNTTIYTVTGLTESTGYYYRVRACNSGGCSPNSNTISVTTLISPPAAPVSLAASDTTQNSFIANWNVSTTATGYYVDVAADVGFSNLLGGYTNNDAGNVTTLLVNGLNPNTTYYYRVRAYNAGGTSSNSGIITVTTLTDVPPAPVANEATNLGQAEFTANWTSSSTATGYYLDVATDNTFTAFVPGFNNFNVLNKTTFSISGLTLNTTYYYRIRAYNPGGTSPNSNTISVTTLLNPPEPPSSPVVNDATDITQTSFTANWASADRATGYKLDVAADNIFSAFVTGYNNKDIPNATSFNVTGLTANNTYYYRVRAYNSGGISTNSGTITVTTLLDPPLPPVANSASAINQTSFTAKWSSSATAEGYYLDIAMDNAFTDFVSGYAGKDVLNVLSYNVTGLTLNTTYYYRIRAYNSGGSGNNSNTVVVTTLLNPPATPDIPIIYDATGVTQTGFTASWSLSGTASGYILDVATNSEFTAFVAGYNNKDVGDVTFYNVTGLTAKTRYYYRIRAYNTGGTSGNSILNTVVTLPNPPPAPTGLTASSCNDKITLRWNESTEPDFVRYIFFWATASNAAIEFYSIYDATETTCKLSGFTHGATYYFRMKTEISPDVESDYSSTVSVKVKTGVIPKIKAKWGDVLICYNQGDSITSFRWYKGNSLIVNETKQYYITNKVSGGYHVEITDKDGCVNSSNAINIGIGKSLSVYPNPAKTSFTLSLKSEEVGKTVVSLFNTSGTKVLEYVTEKPDQELIREIPVSSLQDGLYMIKVTLNDEVIEYTRLVIIE